MKNLDSILPVSDEGLYPIRTVSELSGVNSITLRAWERRYNLFKPKRTPKGHRLYSEKDIQRIYQVLSLLEKGVSIGRVSKALQENQLVSEPTNFQTANKNKKDEIELTEEQWNNYQNNLLSNIKQYDILQLESFHHNLFTLYSAELVSKNLILPVFDLLNKRSLQFPSNSGEYHFYKSFILNRIGGLFIKSLIKNKGKKILFMGLSDDSCDVKLILFAMPLLNHGYNIVNLGCDLTLDAIPVALSDSGADALILHSDNKEFDETKVKEDSVSSEWY